MIQTGGALKEMFSNLMIKNVIMDMGNVLLDYNPMVVIDKYIKNPQDKEIILNELFNGSEWKQGDLGYINDDEMYNLVKERVPSRLHKELFHCVEEWEICMEPVEGAKEFTDYVKKSGYNIYVLSNASKKFYKYFDRFAPFEYFDGIMISADVHMVKPDEGIYHKFLERFSVNPSECLFIDDREDNVSGAVKSGINAVVYKGDFLKIIKNYLH